MNTLLQDRKRSNLPFNDKINKHISWRYLFKSTNVLKYMPHIKKHPEYNKRKTRRIKLRKDDYEHGVDRARKIIDSGKKDKK